METIQAELISLFIAVLTACVGFVAKSITSYLKRKGLVKELENNKETVKIVVKAVEQVYESQNGDEKLSKAKESILSILNQKKIKISDEELNMMIEAVIKEVKSEVKKNK